MRFALVLAALLAVPVSAQDAPADTVTILPGDGTLDTSWLEAGDATYAMRLTAPMQQNVGSADETVALDGGTVTRVMTLSVPMQGMSQTDSLVADAATLAPRAHVSTGGAQEVSLEFMDEGVVGMLTPRSGEATTVTLMTETPVFDSAWSGEIAQSLPLAEGAVFKAPAFAAQDPENTFHIVYTVTGQETVGDRTGWLVDAEMGPITMTYVVDAESRALLATRFSPQPGVSLVIEPSE